MTKQGGDRAPGCWEMHGTVIGRKSGELALNTRGWGRGAGLKKSKKKRLQRFSSSKGLRGQDGGGAL